jgi:N-acetylneuraminate lyase
MTDASSSRPFEGLVAAPHTPFAADGDVALDRVDDQFAHLQGDGVQAVFVAGATGEGLSLSFEERSALFQRWSACAAGTEMRVIAQVGSGRPDESVALATAARAAGVDAFAAVAPSFHRPADVAALIAWLVPIAAAAPELPFYVYDIPELTGVHLATDEVLTRGRARIPNLRGVKYTRAELDLVQRCLSLSDPSFDVLWGRDEALLAGLALGAHGAVGSTYNFAAPLFHRLLRAFAAGDLPQARREQRAAVALVDLLAGYGYLAAAKELMALLGVDCGPPRTSPPLSAESKARLARDLERTGFFDLRQPVEPRAPAP